MLLPDVVTSAVSGNHGNRGNYALQTEMNEAYGTTTAVIVTSSPADCLRLYSQQNDDDDDARSMSARDCDSRVSVADVESDDSSGYDPSRVDDEGLSCVIVGVSMCWCV